MSEWRECSLGEVVESANTGLDAIKRAPIVETDTGIKCLRIQDISQKKDYSDWGFCEVEERNYDKFSIRKGDIFIARTGASIGVNMLFNRDLKSVFNNGLIRLRTNDKKANYEYIYYTLCSYDYKGHIENISGGTSTQPNMQINALLDYEIMLPSLPTQRAIAEVLSSLDDKIDLLKRQNATLETLAQTYFRQWFVEDTNIGRLGDYIQLFDSKRIPLSAMERDKKKNGSLYPYYGAASIMDFVDDYIFDGEYILLGEDGTVETTEGYPILQYATGKFWCNNHAHVIQAKPPYTNYTLWCYLKQCSILHIVTGAVQPKINQENLNSLEIPLPPQVIFDKMNKISETVFAKILANNVQITTLQKLRDTLLPKLISGEVKIGEV